MIRVIEDFYRLDVVSKAVKDYQRKPAMSVGRLNSSEFDE